MGMRDDYRIDPGQDLVCRHGQIDQRVAKLETVGVFESRVATLLRQHRVDQKRGVRIGDLYGGISYLLQLQRLGRCCGRLGEYTTDGKAQGESHGAGERSDLHEETPELHESDNSSHFGEAYTTVPVTRTTIFATIGPISTVGP